MSNSAHRMRLVVAVAMIGMAACRSDQTTDTTDQFLITGAAMSGFGENVIVSLNDAPASGLTVSVNGTPLVEQATGVYYAPLATPVPAGGTVGLTVSNGTITATATGVVPVQPVITGAQHTTMGQPVTATWTTTTSPDSFVVSLNYHLSDGVTAAAVIAHLGGSARQVTLQTSDIPAGSTVFSVGVDAKMHGTFSGAAASGSNMNLRTSATSFDLTIP